MSTLVEGAIDVLVVLVALELLDLGAAGVGWLNSAWGVGGVIGGASAVVLIARGCNATGAADRRAVRRRAADRADRVPDRRRGGGRAGRARRRLRDDRGRGADAVQRLASDAVLARAFGVVEGTYWLTTGIGSLLAPVLLSAVRTARRAARGRRDAAAGRARALARALAAGGVDAGAGAPIRPAARRRHVRAAAGGRARGARAPRRARAVHARARRSSARASPATASTSSPTARSR